HENIRTQIIGRFCAWAVENPVCSDWFSRPIIPLRCKSRHAFLDESDGCFVDLTFVGENSCGSTKAKQHAGNAKQGDRQQPELISKKVTSEHTSENSERDKRNNACRKA